MMDFLSYDVSTLSGRSHLKVAAYKAFERALDDLRKTPDGHLYDGGDVTVEGHPDVLEAFRLAFSPDLRREECLPNPEMTSGQVCFRFARRES